MSFRTWTILWFVTCMVVVLIHLWQEDLLHMVFWAMLAILAGLNISSGDE